ncbi:hypothetical protein [Pleionea sp. CnH1-48]|uniref:hypothetical protein n=1 Tax=Pleionea sp. CnH1-48 TaxID=2954494 RepID=UPI0020973E40|nr:hypothetical protein [Pleionea sp. CnH1-48]MCO7224567.1 hypothetical protein [Pleionea sp. CnH1-48]
MKKLLSLVSVLFIFLLSACDQSALINKIVSEQEQIYAKNIITQLKAENVDFVYEQLSPEYQKTVSKQQLLQLVLMFPTEQEKSVELIGASSNTVNGVWTATLNFEHLYGAEWLISQVVISKKDQGYQLLGVHIAPQSESLKVKNQFSLSEKSMLHYFFFGAMIFNLIFVVVTFLVCIKTPIPERKFWWFVFILCGFFTASLNWTSGAVDIQWLSFQLFAAGLIKVGDYAPTIIRISLPIGAVWFWWKRYNWLAAQKKDEQDNQLDA